MPTSTPPQHESPIFVTNAEDAEAELVGRFHYATLVRSHPRVPGTWLVTFSDARVVGQVAELLGGTPPGSYDGGQTPYVITGATGIDVLLTGPEALDVGWHRQPGHVCDGAVQHDQRGSRPCACPPNLADRKTVARAGHGCHPRTRACFRLLQGPALGTFTFSSGNQAFAEQASHALASLRRDPRPTCARLSLQRTPHRLRSGTTIAYTRPTLVLLGQAT